MKKKLNCILLVDDDEPTNFFHQIIIEEMDCAEEVVAVDSGQAALDYLGLQENGKHPQPDLIFLDINMPAMNGWEFLENYKQLEQGQQSQVTVIMLTTSLNPDDKDKAIDMGYVNSFKNKPLTPEMLQEILEKFFSDRL